MIDEFKIRLKDYCLVDDKDMVQVVRYSTKD